MNSFAQHSKGINIMIKILRWSENKFILSDKIERHCLINVINPEKGTEKFASQSVYSFTFPDIPVGY